MDLQPQTKSLNVTLLEEFHFGLTWVSGILSKVNEWHFSFWNVSYENFHKGGTDSFVKKSHCKETYTERRLTMFTFDIRHN